MNTSSLLEPEIFVKTHVARDLLQNAAVFKTDRQVVWEYVSNGLEYVDEGISPLVHVKLDNRKKRIVIIDNGRGMDWSGLQNFFVMHGENIDRREGRPGRGRFGTGKSAAFGIADILRVTTVRNGKLSKVELHRSDIETMNTEDPIPVRAIERGKPAENPNGTMIEIEGVHLKSLNQSSIIQFIERHLAKWRNAAVFVNNHECEFIEPPVSDIQTFHPEGPQRDKLGDVKLTIKVACAPLNEETRGVSIYSKGVWYETTLAGNEGREMSQYIYGEIDIPKLDEDKSPIPPFDLTRSMQLNPSNELVRYIYAFIGQRIDYIRKELVKADRERRRSEEAKKLNKEAAAIAQVINEDFYDFRQLVSKARAKSGMGFDSGEENQGDTNQEDLILGGLEPAKITSPDGDPGAYGQDGTGGEEPRKLRPQVEPDASGKQLGKPSGGKEGERMARGGFRVEFRPMGKEENRALYVPEERAIYINLDHPQLATAKGENSPEDPTFLRLVYEVAFSEYAIALAQELNINNHFIDTSDPIVEIRTTINRIARKAAHIYSL